MIAISTDWLEQHYPELSLIGDPADPSAKDLAFFLSQRGETRRGMAPLGTGAGPAPTADPAIWPALRAEFHSLVCTDSVAYADLRRELSDRGKATDAAILSAITAAVASILGVAVAALVPLVALCLYALARVGTLTWCRIADPAPTESR